MEKRPGLGGLYKRLRIALLLLAFSFGIAGCPPLVYRDCAWSGTASAWNDINRDGIRDANEAPLEGIRIVVDDTYNQLRRVASVVAQENGEAELQVGLPGCPKTEFIVYSEAPSGYELTSAPELPVKGTDEYFQFGYSYLPNVTPTPHPPPFPISCVGFPYSFYRSAYGNPISFAPSGAAWMVKGERTPLLRFEPNSTSPQEYPRTSDLLGQEAVIDLAYGVDDSLWLATLKGVTQFHPEEMRWTSHIHENGMTSAKAYQLNLLPSNDLFVLTKAGIELLDAKSVKWRVLITTDQIGNNQFAKFVRFGDDLYFITEYQALKFWRDGQSDNVVVQQEVLPQSPFDGIADADIAPDQTLWMVGYSDELGAMAAALPFGGTEWQVHSFHSTDGIIGGERLEKVSASAYPLLWLGGYNKIIGGAINSSQTVEWTSYPQRHFDFQSQRSDLAVQLIGVSPDRSLWLSYGVDTFRCVYLSASP